MPFKAYLPKSLFGRALLIIMLPIAIMQMAVAYFFFNAHWNGVTANLSDSVAADISVAVQLYKQDPSFERAQRLDNMLRPKMELSVALEKNDTLPITTRDAFFSNLDKTLRRALGNSLNDEFWFDTTRYPHHIDIRVAVDEGVLRFIAARDRVFAPTGFVFIFWLVTATVLLSLVSILFIRNQAKPISELADAAETFGKGGDISNYKPSGASEVRLAGQSFLKMRSRLKRHIEQRTTMLAGVSHDLRTPLTRLKLHLAMQRDTTDNDAAKQDLLDMESMLNGYLDFARGLTGEETVSLDIKSYVQDIISRMKSENLSLICGDNVRVELKPQSFERALKNLISNALKYGTYCQVTVRSDNSNFYFEIEDDGPGIPEDRRHDAMRPFQRLDTARNQNIEGIGLGLAIVGDITQLHGGTLRLDESELGGLKATIRLPK